jgi:hypothetical protein
MSQNRSIARGLATLVLSAAIVTGSGATAALAHECFNASRSATGDARAAAGQGWTLASDIILMFAIPDEVGLDPLTPEQLAEAQAIIAEEKASGDFDEIYAADRAILDHATAMNGRTRDGYPSASDDEHAIEHVFADFAEVGPLFEHLVGIYLTVTS